MSTNHTGFKPYPDKIVICPRCLGHGYFDREEMTDMQGKDNSTKRQTCACCNGSGRMVSKLILTPLHK